MLSIFRYLVFKFRYSRSAGFTLIEILVVLAVVGIVAGIGVSSLSNVNTTSALTVEAEKVLSLLAKARSFTLAAKDGVAYGVHIESGKAVLFKGVSYSAGASSNQVQALHSEVTISTFSLAGGGSEVKFQKLTGSTAEVGTITLRAVRNAQQTKVITVNATGIASSN
ncbi:MAG: prepilin-type N-terminal cleavage/methylation domain-containing protein [bacterium]|nr:prepilin-type N-terminal cleavage/methylation domain-containing protein [bacterium]